MFQIVQVGFRDLKSDFKPVMLLYWVFLWWREAKCNHPGVSGKPGYAAVATPNLSGWTQEQFVSSPGSPFQEGFQEDPDHRSHSRSQAEGCAASRCVCTITTEGKAYRTLAFKASRQKWHVISTHLSLPNPPKQSWPHLASRRAGKYQLIISPKEHTEIRSMSCWLPQHGCLPNSGSFSGLLLVWGTQNAQHDPSVPPPPFSAQVSPAREECALQVLGTPEANDNINLSHHFKSGWGDVDALAALLLPRISLTLLGISAHLPTPSRSFAMGLYSGRAGFKHLQRRHKDQECVRKEDALSWGQYKEMGFQAGKG